VHIKRSFNEHCHFVIIFLARLPFLYYNKVCVRMHLRLIEYAIFIELFPFKLRGRPLSPILLLGYKNIKPIEYTYKYTYAHHFSGKFRERNAEKNKTSRLIREIARHYRRSKS
jgi:hypothetical protein